MVHPYAHDPFLFVRFRALVLDAVVELAVGVRRKEHQGASFRRSHGEVTQPPEHGLTATAHLINVVQVDEQGH